MAKFQQPICGVRLSDGLYVLWETYTYHHEGQDIIVPKGFVWDGASVPRWLWTISGIRKDGRIRAAALIHDYLYPREGKVGTAWWLSRLEVDQLFYEMMQEGGMSWWRATRAYWAVRLFGRWSWGK